MVVFSQYTSVYVIRIDSSVTSIPPKAFKDRIDLKEVELPEGLQEIGADAFSGCTSLRKINLVEGLRVIGPSAFRCCTALIRVDIPSTLTVIAEGVFSKCASLLRIDIPASLEVIGEEAFVNCTSLLRIDIPASVNSIGLSAFDGCSNLKEVNLRDGLEVIGAHAFRECTSLLRIDIPASVNSIGYYAFRGCSNLKEVNLCDGFEVIGEGAFRDCTSLLRINIPASVNSIGDGAFQDCRYLRNILISPSSALEQDGIYFFDSFRGLFPTVDMIKARFDHLPIHRLCFYHSHEVHPNTRTLLEGLVAQSVEPSVGVDCFEMTPLHVLACSGSHDLKLYEYLIECYHEAMTVEDEWGEKPLDYILLSEAPNDVIQLFLRSHAKHWSDVTPFDVHKTIQRCKSKVFLKNLIKAQRTSFPELVIDWQSIADESVHRNVPLGLYGVLVLASISPRFIRMSYEHQLEVDNTIASIIDSGEDIAPEQYADIRMLISEYTHYFQEVTTAIELAVWKAKFYELFVENNGNELHKIRSDSYIQSGKVCAVVIPLVLSFL